MLGPSEYYFIAESKVNEGFWLIEWACPLHVCVYKWPFLLKGQAESDLKFIFLNVGKKMCF